MSSTTTDPGTQRRRGIMLHCVLTALIAASLTLTIGCSDDPPVTPEPVAYNIYATANKYYDGEKESRVYVYDADSLTLLDSIPLPHVGDWAQVSPDGRSLYLVMWRYRDDYKHYIAKVDVTTGTMVWTQEVPIAAGASDYSPFNSLDSGRLLAFGGILFDSETGAVVRQHDYQAENHLTLQFGPPHGTEVAAIHFDSVPYNYFDASDTQVVVVDLVTGQSRGSFVPRFKQDHYPMFVYRARLHPDGKRVLLMTETSGAAWFVIGNVTTGELIMYDRLTTSEGEIAVSRDGTMAAVVDEAALGWGIGLPAVYLYDIVNYQHLKTFYNELCYLPGQARFLPGDRRLAVFSSTNPIGSDWLQVFDLNTLTREHCVDTPFYNVLGGAFAIGPRPAP
jgi:hypothetical protein